jgi:glycosyltransferase involved in cell wall biosynthesis
MRKMLFVGRLIPLKRVDALLSIVATLPDVALVVVGEGDQRAALERMAADLGIENRVEFTGAIGEEAVWSVLAQSSLLVLNSTTENCPHVLLEAMAMGLPVVSARVGGVPEIVQTGVNGVLVDPHDSSELRAAIQKILGDDRLRAELGAAAKASMARFSWRSTADAVATVLRESCTS